MEVFSRFQFPSLKKRKNYQILILFSFFFPIISSYKEKKKMKKKILVLSVLLLVSAAALFAAITKQDAENIAIKESGIASSDIEYMRTRLDWENGERVYDVEFYAAGVEYDYEIALSDGKILSYDREAERIWNRSSQDGISRDEALLIAFENAGISEKDASRVRVEMDRDDGVTLYEIEFRSADYKYEYEISNNAEILSYQIEKRGLSRVGRDAVVIDRAEAEAIITSYLPEGVEIVGFERDYDDGRYTYEAKAYGDGIEYEVEIDAVTRELTSYQEEVERWR